MASDLNIRQEDWDSVEFQKALKIVIKCEIVSLLERLSETGEETVLLMANTTDLRVGHLASTKGERFVSREEVDVIKNRFLYFCTVSDAEETEPHSGPNAGQGRVRSMAGPKIDKNPLTIFPLEHGMPAASGMSGRGRKPRAPSTKSARRGRGGRGGAKAGLPHTQQYYPGQMLNSGAQLPESDVQKGDCMSQNMGASGKRSLSSPDPHTSQPTDKRTKLDTKNIPTVNQSLNVANKVSSLPQPAAFSDTEELDNQTTPGIKVADSSKSVKSLQHHLGNSEFEKFLKQYHKEIGHDDDSYVDSDTYDEDEEIGEFLEEGEMLGPNPNIRLHAPLQQNVQRPGPTNPQKNIQMPVHTQPKQQQNLIVHPQMKQSTSQSQSAAPQNKQTVSGSVAHTQPQMSASLALASKSMKPKLDEKRESKPEANIKSVEKDSGKESGSRKEIVQNLSESEKKAKSDESKDTMSAGQQGENTTDIRKPTVSQTGHFSGSQVTHETQKLAHGMTGAHGGGENYDSDEEFDVETYLAQNRAKQAKEQSELEADVNDKLGLLSAKLSWVVEYPKGDERKSGPMSGSPAQPTGGTENLPTTGSANFTPSLVANMSTSMAVSMTPGGAANLPRDMMAQAGTYPGGAMVDFPEGYDDEDEEEDYDEDELDEAEIAALQKYRQARQQSAGKLESLHRAGMERKDFPADMPENIRMLLQQYSTDEEDEVYDDEEFQGEMDEQYEEYNSEREMEAMNLQGQHGMGSLQRQPPDRIGNVTHRGLGYGNNMGSAPANFGQITSIDGDRMPPQMAEYFASTDNYDVMGEMSKCLECSKIIRTAGIPAHSKMHFEEDEGDEDIEDIEEEEHFMGENDMVGQELTEHEIGEHEIGAHNMGAHDMGGHDLSGHGIGEHEIIGHEMGEHEMIGHEMGGNELTGHEVGEHEIGGHEMEEQEMGQEYEELEQENTQTETPVLNERALLEQIEKLEELRDIQPPPGKKSTACDICGKVYVSAANMLRHRKIHSTEKTHACHVCDKTFKFPAYLKKHLQVHKKKNDLEPGSQGEMSTGSTAGAVSPVVSSRIT